MNIYRELDSYIFTGSTTSEVVIAYIDSFSQSCTESTTIVMDQASIHTSNSIENKLLEWETKGIHIFWLPTYTLRPLRWIMAKNAIGWLKKSP